MNQTIPYFVTYDNFAFSFLSNIAIKTYHYHRGYENDANWKIAMIFAFPRFFVSELWRNANKKYIPYKEIRLQIEFPNKLASQ